MLGAMPQHALRLGRCFCCYGFCNAPALFKVGASVVLIVCARPQPCLRLGIFTMVFATCQPYLRLGRWSFLWFLCNALVFFKAGALFFGMCFVNVLALCRAGALAFLMVCAMPQSSLRLRRCFLSWFFFNVPALCRSGALFCLMVCSSPSLLSGRGVGFVYGFAMPWPCFRLEIGLSYA